MLIRTIKIWVYLLFAVCLLVFPAGAGAVVIDVDSIKPLSDIELLPKEDFAKQTDLVRETPFGDKFLSYQMRLPKGWTSHPSPPTTDQASGGLGDRVLGIVARYFSPPNKHLRSFFTLEAQELTYEIGAKNWFLNYVMSSGLSLEQIGDERYKQVEALYVEVEGDITYIVRIKVILNGPRMVAARYYVPQELYEEEYVRQAQVIDSFQLTNREERGVEELKIYGFLDQSFFDYPVSWTLNAPYVRSIDRMRAMLYYSTVNGKLDGQINIYLTNKKVGTTRAEEVAFYKDKFKIENYVLGDYLGAPYTAYHDDMSFGVTQVYAMTPQVTNMIDYELWVSIMEGEEYYYVISLLSPARHEEFFTWARNVEAYKLVVRGIRREDESVDYYQFIQ